jgi:hypothetical protein
MPVLAQEEPYLDDRSSPQALVRSLYNAINRKEFARDYAYFANPPAATLDDYAKGYGDTESVTLVVGTPASEGAAGSTFYSLPVAISAAGANEQVFAGCYTLRLANPQVQGQPFVPLSIEKGALKPVSGPIETALPASCPDGPALPAQNLAIERAQQKFLASRMDACQVEEGNEPKAWDIGFHYASDAPDAEESKVTLIQFFCTRGAYNEVYAYYIVDTIGEVKELHFAEPDLDIRYENDDSEGKLESMTVIGFNTTDVLINADYDPDTRSITSWSKWRGVGDASTSGRWIFREGDFALVHYEVDPTYNGEIDPQPVLDYDTGP